MVEFGARALARGRSRPGGASESHGIRRELNFGDCLTYAGGARRGRAAARRRAATSPGPTSRSPEPPVALPPVKVLLVIALLPARGRRRRAAAAQVRDAPAGARDRDARARARRPEVDPPRRGAAGADAGVGAPRPLHRPEGAARSPRSCTGAQGVGARSCRRGRFGRRLLFPDENVSWNLTAIPAAIRIVRSEGIDVVITTSPPGSRHLVGAAVKRATGAKWVADLRDSLVAHPHRRAESALVRAKEKGAEGVARVVARSADAIVCVSDAIADEARRFEPRGPVVHDRERRRLRRLRRPRVPPRQTGSGSRTPARSSASATRGRSCTALADSGLDDASRASSATSARPTASGPRRSGSATGWS